MDLMGIPQFKQFFRQAASLDIDKNDLRRFYDFVGDRTYKLLVRAEAAAKANGRDIIEPRDLPITKGLQECMHAYRKIDQAVELAPILARLTQLPPLDLDYSEETREQLPQVSGGLGVALARCFRLLDDKVKNPQTTHWDKAEQVFDLLL
ncbi:DUF1931 family protein [Arthrobacter sp. KN11-1C]|uniref:DUF1931 family protein n=1 Tax=Arthrobacter sp. KN11-1C TaxID=3445774 RepID=UPI003FA00A7C